MTSPYIHSFTMVLHHPERQKIVTLFINATSLPDAIVVAKREASSKFKGHPDRWIVEAAYTGWQTNLINDKPTTIRKH